MVPPMESPYLTAVEVARYLRVDAQTVRRWCATGEMRAVRVGKLLRVDRSELERFTSGQKS